MKTYDRYKPGKLRHRTIREVFFLLAIAVALGLGLALASPALGAGLLDTPDGDITGAVTVSGGSPAGVSVELHVMASDTGADKVLATSITDSQGVYHFVKQPSVTNTSYYILKLTGGTGTLASWYSWPIGYVAGQDVTIPSIEMSDVHLLLQQGATIKLPNVLEWEAHRSGETYRVYIYAQGDAGKVVLDSGSLGMHTALSLDAGALPEGSYDGVVQVRDITTGQGLSRSRFRFTVSKASDESQPTTQNPGTSLGPGTGSIPGQAATPASSPTESSIQSVQPVPATQAPATAIPAVPAVPAVPTAPVAQASPTDTPTVAPAPPTQAPPPTNVPQAPSAGTGAPQLQLDLSANRSAVEPGESLIYKIEVTNKGDGAANGVVVTDDLPAGVTVDSSTTRSTHGTVFIQGNSVTVQVGVLAPNTKAVVEIPVSVSRDAATANLSNQASAQYQGAPAPVGSNPYVAQVSAPLTSQNPAPQQQPPASPPQEKPQSPPNGQVQQPSTGQSGSSSQAPDNTHPASPPKQPSTSQNTAPQVKSPVALPAKKPAAPTSSSMPQTGGAFPIVFALVLLLVTLLARYLRGRSYRRV